MLNNNLIKYMEEQDEQLRTDLMEGMLECIEGNRSFRSILAMGVTAHNKRIKPNNPSLAEVVSQLNIIGNQVADGKSYSKREIRETFTTMLEKLTKN